MSNGGQIIGNNFHAFPRFKLIDLGREHRELMSALRRDTPWKGATVTPCCRVNTTGNEEAREDMCQYKYALDVDVLGEVPRPVEIWVAGI
jgi:hypothetical protein